MWFIRRRMHYSLHLCVRCAAKCKSALWASNRETLLFAPNACFIVRSDARCMSADFLQPENSLLLRPGAPVCFCWSACSRFILSLTGQRGGDDSTLRRINKPYYIACCRFLPLEGLLFQFIVCNLLLISRRSLRFATISIIMWRVDKAVIIRGY